MFISKAIFLKFYLYIFVCPIHGSMNGGTIHDHRTALCMKVPPVHGWAATTNGHNRCVAVELQLPKAKTSESCCRHARCIHFAKSLRRCVRAHLTMVLEWKLEVYSRVRLEGVYGYIWRLYSSALEGTLEGSLGCCTRVNLETVLNWTWSYNRVCTWRLPSSILGGTLGSTLGNRTWVQFGVHWCVQMETSLRCTWRNSRGSIWRPCVGAQYGDVWRVQGRVTTSLYRWLATSPRSSAIILSQLLSIAIRCGTYWYRPLHLHLRCFT